VPPICNPQSEVCNVIIDRRLTCADLVQHPTQMAPLLQRMVVVLLAALTAGNTAICAGWASTPEARMTCCQDETNCPMHQGESAQGAASGTLTQAQADSCCATSEQGSSSSSSSFFELARPDQPAVSPVAAAAPPRIVVIRALAGDAPDYRPPLSIHLLLSVILV
jgi:hypothetical protein